MRARFLKAAHGRRNVRVSARAGTEIARRAPDALLVLVVGVAFGKHARLYLAELRLRTNARASGAATQGSEATVRAHLVHSVALHVLQNDVIELMHEDSQLLFVCEFAHELWVIDHLKLSCNRIDADTSGRNGIGGLFMDSPRESGKERLVLKESPSMFI